MDIPELIETLQEFKAQADKLSDYHRWGSTSVAAEIESGGEVHFRLHVHPRELLTGELFSVHHAKSPASALRQFDVHAKSVSIDKKSDPQDNIGV